MGVWIFATISFQFSPNSDHTTFCTKFWWNLTNLMKHSVWNLNWKINLKSHKIVLKPFSCTKFNLLFNLKWSSFFYLLCYITFARTPVYFGNEYVDKPKLVQVEEKDKHVWLEKNPQYFWVWSCGSIIMWKCTNRNI